MRIEPLASFYTSQKQFAESSYREARRRKIIGSLHSLSSQVSNMALDSSSTSRPTWLPNGVSNDEDWEWPVDEILKDQVHSQPSEEPRQPTSDSSACDEKPFALFPSFVVELRIKIWTHTLPGPRILEILDGKDKQVMMIDSFSSILGMGRACKESREVVLKRYQQVPTTAFGLRGLPPTSKIPFDLREDLYI
ncbi:hypothetical protein DL98DRAFT_216890 [Cadophora sp. DSE1049]|nr:hypothetical protein DL98DRAFT_216890 [Cadophora sp. DSE1049]